MEGIVITFKVIGWEGYFTIGGRSKTGFIHSRLPLLLISKNQVEI